MLLSGKGTDLLIGKSQNEKVENVLTLIEEENFNDSEIKKYQALSQLVLNQLTPYLKLYKFGQFDSLNSTLSEDIAREMGSNIQSQSNYTTSSTSKYTYKKETFNQIRSSFHDVLDGLDRGIIQNNVNTTLQNRVSHCDSILNNAKNLINYFNNKYRQSGGIIDLNINLTLTVSPIIKPEYVRYIQRYGLPINGIFESEKLSIILLEIQGITSEDLYFLDNFEI